MLPLIWSDTLFRDGLAGSLPSMLSYVIAAVYIYRTARLVTGSRAGGWIAAAALMLNPSLLYMQSTAMSEVPSLAAFVVAIYYAVRLAETHHAQDLVKCAAAVAAGTLIRYDDWLLALALVPTLALIAWRQRGKALAEAWTILFGLLAFAGCAAWVIYNWLIFHDPLKSFFYGSSTHTFFANSPGRVIPRNFLGLSLEIPAVVTEAGADPHSLNPVLEQLIRNLAPGQSPVLRRSPRSRSSSRRSTAACTGPSSW